MKTPVHSRPAFMTVSLRDALRRSPADRQGDHKPQTGSTKEKSPSAFELGLNPHQRRRVEETVQ
ncbi:MAG: hypothetical protein M0P63_14415, partial [Azoarcus sp.]|nr:hypothetical protein [Azoarcus sp.]